MQTRNAVFTASGAIDCEINHPVYGWIPFTASPDDPEQHGRDIFAALQSSAAPYVAPPEPDPAEALAAERAGMVCSRFQAKAALHEAGLLSAAQTVMESADPVAQIAWADAVEFRRNSPTIAAIASELDLTDEQIDDLFRTAMQIEA